MHNKLAFTITRVAIVLGVLFLAACSPNATPTPSAPAAPRSVPPSVAGGTPTTAPTAAPTLVTRAQTLKVRITGNLIAATQASLSFQVAGRVLELKAPEGTRVKAGAVLAVLDTSSIELQIAQAQAALDLANANWNRVKQGPTLDDVAIAKSNLDRAKAAVDQAQAAYDRIGGASNPFIATTAQSLALQQAASGYQGAVAQYNLTLNRPTQSERETSQAQVAQAQAALDLAKQSVNNARIVAPFDGTVIWVGPKAGESVTTSTPVFIVADLTQMQVLINVDENTLAGIRLGQTATISVDAAADKPLTGRVKKIGFLATTTGGVVSVPVTLDIDKTDAPLYPGLSATVEIMANAS